MVETARILVKAAVKVATVVCRPIQLDVTDAPVKRVSAPLIRSAATTRGTMCVLTNAPMIAVDVGVEKVEHRYPTGARPRLNRAAMVAFAKTACAIKTPSVA